MGTMFNCLFNQDDNKFPFQSYINRAKTKKKGRVNQKQPKINAH